MLPAAVCSAIIYARPEYGHIHKQARLGENGHVMKDKHELVLTLWL